MRTSQKLVLPQNFAQCILDNQIQLKLTEKPSSEVICNLIELYSKGVEYFESIKSYKYLYFKKKMAELFADDTRIFTDPKKQEYSEQPENPISKKLKSKNEDERIQAIKIKEKQKQMEIQVNERTKTQVTKKQAQKIINNIAETQKFLYSKIKSTLQTQNKALQQKLLQRKKRNICKSFSAYGLTQGSTTKESLFNDQLDKGLNQPLIVNFENVIKDQDSQDQDQKQQIINQVKPVLKGRMASMGQLAE